MGSGARVLVAALAGAVGIACGPSTAPREAGREVPARWREVRESPNHALHLGAGVLCADCHQAADFADVRLAACERCHAAPRAHVHAMATLTITSTTRVSDAACFPCHAFETTAPRATRACLDCHAQATGARRAISGHTEETCLACHGPHTKQRAAPRPCIECHTDRAAMHGDAPTDCARCHGPHDPKGTAEASCARCHAERAPRVNRAESLPGHPRCTTCHAPHARETGGLVPCVECHADQAKALARDDAARNAVGHGCIGCHPPHGADAVARARPRFVATATATGRDVQLIAHAVRAAREHGAAPHRPCTACHAELAPAGWAHGPAARCEDCHTPHVPRGARPDLSCARCHDVEAVAPGHRDCARCHVDAAHTPRPEPQRCSDCHADEAARAPEGHRDCARCHEPHARVAPGKTCGSCHADHTDGPHRAIDCRQCHGPHDGAAPPRCEGCHARADLGGLHQAPEHARCDGCHGSAHGVVRGPGAAGRSVTSMSFSGLLATAAPSDRATCLTCHTGRRAHFPEAQRCVACHTFAPKPTSRQTDTPGSHR